MAKATDTDTRMAPRGFGPVLAAMGPGVVLAGGVVGSGELINTPIQAAKFGFILLWAVIIACLINPRDTERVRCSRDFRQQNLLSRRIGETTSKITFKNQ